jgi:hypothetical protein
MGVDARIQQKFRELELELSQIHLVPGLRSGQFVKTDSWQKWATSFLNLLNNAFGAQSMHFQRFASLLDGDSSGFTQQSTLDSAKGIFHAGKEDYEGGYVFSLQKAVSGEVFGDFVLLAKKSLTEGHKDVAAVLACAALEDALQRYARAEGVDVDGADMTAVVNALKSKGLVNGAQKTLLDAMPKIRNYAMHADWDKINSVTLLNGLTGTG